MRFFVGTSGFSYKEWKGAFYPDALPQKDMLGYYAARFSTVEINNTFYKFPSESIVKSWAEQVPESFRFVLKARQVITHFRRLQNADQETGDFFRIASLLGEREGPILFQLPPNFKKDVPRLEAFLAYAAGRSKLVFEFRHNSWFDKDTFACLRAIHRRSALPTGMICRTPIWSAPPTLVMCACGLKATPTKVLKNGFRESNPRNGTKRMYFSSTKTREQGPS